MSHSVDHAEIKLGQLLTIGMAVLAIYTGSTQWLIALGVIFLISGTYRPLSPFVMLYKIIGPLKLIKSDYRLDNIQPHKFGQLIGALTVLIAVLLIENNLAIAGWGVSWVLIGLTAISFAGWCIGCFMYYQLNRLGLGGFFKHKPTDDSVLPGQRPTKKVS